MGACSSCVGSGRRKSTESKSSASSNDLPLRELQRESHISRLPNHLLENIFGHLDVEPYLLSHLDENPGDLLGHKSPQTLKNCSLVSKKWRSCVLPLLKRHARLELNLRDLDFTLSHLHGFLEFIQRSQVQVHTLTLVSCSNIPVLKMDFSVSNMSLMKKRCEAFWKAIFNAIPAPMRVTIIASQFWLAFLTNCFTQIYGSFDNDVVQMISMFNANSASFHLPAYPMTNKRLEHGSTPLHKGLLHIYPWTAIHINEGVYDYPSDASFLRREERGTRGSGIFHDLSRPTRYNATPMWPQTAKSFSYVVVDPMAREVDRNMALLPAGIENLRIRFALNESGRAYYSYFMLAMFLAAVPSKVKEGKIKEYQKLKEVHCDPELFPWVEANLKVLVRRRLPQNNGWHWMIHDDGVFRRL